MSLFPMSFHRFALAPRRLAKIALAMIGLTFVTVPALALPNDKCKTTGTFEEWMAGFRAEAAAQGISPQVISASLDGVTYDQRVYNADRGQAVFRQSFEQFSARMISSFRVSKGTSLLKQHAALLARIEKEFGVPGPIIVAIWGLETDYGANIGSLSAMRSLATLSYDCRRSAFFRAQFLDALRIVQRGDLKPSEMKGAWAGELGQTQFLPSVYLKYAINYGGGRDLLHSPPDVLASTANYLKGFGWKPGQGWEPGQPNFETILLWNKAQVYAKTVAAFATKLANASGYSASR